MNEASLNTWLTRLALAGSLLFTVCGMDGSNVVWIMTGLGLFIAAALLVIRARTQVGQDASELNSKWIPGLAATGGALFLLCGAYKGGHYKIWILLGIGLFFSAGLLYLRGINATGATPGAAPSDQVGNRKL